MKTLVLATLLLTGCAAQQCPPAGIETKVITKTVDVQRPCPITVPPRPAKLPDTLPQDSLQLAALLGAKLAEYSAPGAYADRAEAALRTCVKP